jgi:regulatory protein
VVEAATAFLLPAVANQCPFGGIHTLSIMNIITDITAQKRNKGRLNLFIDGRYAFSLALEAAAGLKIGQPLSEAEIAGLKTADTYAQAKNDAVRLISYRPRSVREVTQKLVQKGYDDLVIERVVQHLQEVELLNDRAFADYWVEQRLTFKPRSRLALQHELRGKGVDRRVIETAVADIDEEEAAHQAIAAKLWQWRDLPQEQFEQKAGQYLQRRGFGYDIIRPVLHKAWQTVADEHNTTA